MSKGSGRRPAQVSESFVRAEYERIFAKEPAPWPEVNSPEYFALARQYNSVLRALAQARKAVYYPTMDDLCCPCGRKRLTRVVAITEDTVMGICEYGHTHIAD